MMPCIPRPQDEWRPITECKPTLGMKILGWCVHDEDPYTDNGHNRLLYQEHHIELGGHVQDGLHVLEWGGAYSVLDYHLPDWWFLHGSGFEIAANPVLWLPVPEVPKR